jgi:hypothetical protein
MGAQSDLITQAEFCRRHRIGRTRLKKLLAEGLPRRGKKIPAARAAARLADNLVEHERKDHWGNGADGGGTALLNELRRQARPFAVAVPSLTTHDVSEGYDAVVREIGSGKLTNNPP